jgi:hypothetical protein
MVRPLQRPAVSNSMTEKDSFPSEPMVCAEATRGVKQHGAKESMRRVLITPRHQPQGKEDGEKRCRYKLVHCRQQSWRTPFALFSDVSPLCQLHGVRCKMESSTFFILRPKCYVFIKDRRRDHHHI